MIWDPVRRLRKYADLKAKAGRMGFCAEILLGKSETDGIVLWPGSSATDPRRGGGRLMVMKRDRGCFVSFGLSGMFRADSEAIAGAVCWELLKSGAEKYDAATLQSLAEQHGLDPAGGTDWSSGESSDSRTCWADAGWRRMSEPEADFELNRWQASFVDGAGRLIQPAPFRSWNTSSEDGSPLDVRVEEQATLVLFDALCQCSAHDEPILVLDFQHPCYRYFPHQGVRIAYREYWAVPVLPDGDSVYFQPFSFEFGIQAQWTGELHIFGKKFVNAACPALAELLGPPVKTG